MPLFSSHRETIKSYLRTILAGPAKMLLLLPKLLFCLHSIKLISAVTFDFSLIYFVPNNTRQHQFPARREISEGLRNATTIVLNQQVPMILRSFDVSFARNLESLSLHDCGINEIESGSFKNLSSLKHLNITKNNIKIIKDDIFNHMGVNVLNLSYNKLATISPSAFDNMANLTDLILDYNELTSYSIWFENCPKLITISLQFNFIQYLPAGIYANLLDHKLKAYFSYNKINKIHEDLFDVEEFTDLYLDHNELEEFDFTLCKIDTLSLQTNQIECLSEEFIKNEVGKVTRFFLGDNPINCSCYDQLSTIQNMLVSFSEC
ncbi:unnamed protein product [Phaedon cochleariae]|uniref:Toll-like receptor n=1 Tax=Phaedon cochleariae TaxID=80249 RepID=A0A9P0DHP6_PHACE|nr:unnamed protein product [Phaedon cochleariae]